jgi:excisionase family DNA binding protein
MTKRFSGDSVYPNVKAFADEIGICHQVAYRGLRDGTIPSIRLGKRFIISKDAVRDWLQRITNAGTDGRVASLQQSQAPRKEKAQSLPQGDESGVWAI